ncbi:MAG: proprotein convertase P-domain-containing protein [archaeon]|nr:proprotein convertase P-domain-containing protein [archaeon]MCP8315030.1 proprotein convertase P-domain-containing protein [archaeon]MCP8318015.1 proprotein convertase P-domain-containing protein [archaeon]MCP8322476.1 proprotein convertase P-domain-containing protein [archaeon]
MNLVKRERIGKLLINLTLTSMLILSTVMIVPEGKCQVTKVYVSTDVPKDINDRETIESMIIIPDKGTIEDINVKLTIHHTYDADLDVILISPNGTEIELFDDVGKGDNDFIDTILDDEADMNITNGSAPFTGRYRPEESLSVFDEEEMKGTWKLRIYDDLPNDVGTLDSWSIEITYPSSPISTQLWFWPLVLGVIIVVTIVIIIVLKRRKPAPPIISPSSTDSSLMKTLPSIGSQ